MAQRAGKDPAAHALQAACQAGGILEDRSFAFGVPGAEMGKMDGVLLLYGCTGDDLEAEEAVLLNQEYTIGTKSLKRADLGTIRAAIKDLEKQIDLLESGGKNKAFRFVPRDI